MSAISNNSLSSNYYNYNSNSAMLAESARVGTPRTATTGSQTDIKVPISQNDFQVDLLEGSSSKPLANNTHAATGINTQAGVNLAINKPTVVTSVTDVVPMMQNGDFKMAIPLVGGTKLGPMTVRDGSRAAMTFKVDDGKIDYSQTRIYFDKEDGSETDLDGPLFIDPKSIYIDENGHIIAEIKCFPDINITKWVIGEKKVPDTMEGMAKLLAKLSGKEGDITLYNGGVSTIDSKPNLPTINVDGSEISVITAPNEEEPEEDPIDYSYNDSTDPLDVHHYSIGQVMKNPVEALMSALDLNNTEISFTGSLKAGPVALGKDLSFNVEEGSKVEIKGTPHHMVASMNLPAKSLNMNANGTVLRAGNGNIAIDIDFSRATDRDDAFNFNTPMDMGITFKSINVDNFYAETPSTSGQKNILEFGKFNMTAGGDNLLHMATKEGVSTIDFVVPKTEVTGLSGQVELTGSDGQPSIMKIGSRAHENGAEMKMAASIEMHSDSGIFKLDADVENLAASVERLAVVDSDCFDLVMSGAKIGGSGHLLVDNNGTDCKIDFQSAANQPFTMSTGIEDAFLGDPNKEGILLDLANGSAAAFSLDQLSLGGSGSKPVFRAKAAVDVRLDALKLPMGDSYFELPAGTSGSLVIRDMGWKEGASSPDFNGELRLSLGRDLTKFKAGPMEGLDGASVEIDSKSGEAILVLAATLDENGNVKCAGGLSFDHTVIKAEAHKGDLQVEQAQLPQTKPTLKSSDLKKMRTLAEKPEIKEDISQIDVNQVIDKTIAAVDPDIAEIVGMLKQTNVKIKVPIDKLSGELLKISTKKDVDRMMGLYKDTTGYEVTINGQREAAPLTVDLAISDGNVQAKKEAVNLNPPLKLTVKGQYWLPVTTGSASLEVGVTIKRMEIRVDDKTGLASIVPVFELDHPIISAAQWVYSDLQDKLGTMLGGIIGETLFGSKEFSTNFKELYKKLDENIISAESGETAEPSEIGQQVSTQLPGLLEKIHINDIDINISKTKLNAGTIDLGGGQKLTIGEGSQLEISGTPDNFIIKGSAILGETAIGNDEIGAQLNGARVDLDLRIKGAASGTPKITMDLSNIKADNLGLNGSINGANLSLKNGSVTSGTLHFEQREDKDPLMSFDFPKIKANVDLHGGGQIGDMAAFADKISGSINGSLKMQNETLTGKIDDLKIDAKNLKFGSKKCPTSTDLSLSGAGQVTIDPTGNITFSKLAGRKLNLDVNAVLSDGSKYVIGGGTVDKIVLDNESTTVTGVKGKLDCVANLPVGDDGNQMLLDIRSADISGGIKIGSTFSTVGPVKLENIDASTTNLVLNSESFGLNLTQFDLSGNGTFNMAETGEITIKSLSAGSLAMDAKADDLRFTISEPDVNIDLDKGVALRGNVDMIRFCGEQPFALKASNGQFYGKLEAGHVAMPIGIGQTAVEMTSDTKMSADFSIDYDGVNTPALDVKIDLSGGLKVDGTDMAQVATSAADLHLNKVEADGQFQMQLIAKTDGKGQFAASTAVELTAKMGLEASGKVNSENLSLGE